MSFILDALRKSEAERQRQAGPALLEMRIVRPQRRVPAWLLVVGAVLILVNLAGLAWLLLRPSPTAPTAAAATTVGASAGTASSAPGAVQLAPGERLIGPAAGSMTASQATDGTLPPLLGADDGSIAGDANPADFLPAEAARRTPRTGVLLRNYADISSAVPPLRLDLHVYEANPSLRYAFINMKKLREGDATAEGVKVLEITPDGVVMSYRNSEFLLTGDSTATDGSAVPGADSR